MGPTVFRVAQGRQSVIYYFIFVLFLIMCRCMCLHVGMYTGVQVPMEMRGVSSLGSEITDSCESSDVGAGNQAQVLSKSSKCA